MGRKTFTILASTLDDINVEKDAAMKKAAKEIAVYYAGSRADTTVASGDIDKLLKNFSDADKFLIMKYAFLRVI